MDIITKETAFTYDYTKSKNETAAKNKARADICKLFYEFLVENFGEENVGYVDRDTIGFVFGTVNDKDGFPCDMAATVKPVIKSYQDHVGEKRTTKAFDFYESKRVYEETGRKNEE